MVTIEQRPSEAHGVGPLNAGRIELRLLGHFQLLMDEKPVDGMSQTRLQLLLAYVTLHRNLTLSRQHLAFLFWPDSLEFRANSTVAAGEIGSQIGPKSCEFGSELENERETGQI